MARLLIIVREEEGHVKCSAQNIYGAFITPPNYILISHQ